MERIVKIYHNEDVEKIVAGIPDKHYHVRFAIYFKDQVIVLQEAIVAALVRAYAYTAIHPLRRGVILEGKNLSKDEKKHGFAYYQLIEKPRSEDEAVETITRLLYNDNDAQV